MTRYFYQINEYCNEWVVYWNQLVRLNIVAIISTANRWLDFKFGYIDWTYAVRDFWLMSDISFLYKWLCTQHDNACDFILFFRKQNYQHCVNNKNLRWSQRDTTTVSWNHLGQVWTQYLLLTYLNTLNLQFLTDTTTGLETILRNILKFYLSKSTDSMVLSWITFESHNFQND